MIHGRRFLLLFVTFGFMLLHICAQQGEMLAIGSLTRSNADFFTLFAPTKDGHIERVDTLSQEAVNAQWDHISPEGAPITKIEAARYMAQRKDRNPLNRIMNLLAGHTSILQNLLILAVVLVVIALVKGVAFFGSQYTRQLVMIRVSRDLRQRYFEHIQTLSLDFYAQYNVGSLSTRVTGDALQIATAVYAAMVTYIQTPVQVLISLTMCFFVSVELSLLMFVGFPLFLIPILYFAKRFKKLARKALANSEVYSSSLLDSLSGIQTIKLFAMEKFSIRKFKEQNDRVAWLAEKGARYGYLARPVLHMSGTLMLAGIILYGVYFAKLSVSEILVFCGLVYLMYEPIKRLNDENIQIQSGVVAAERIWEVLKLKPKIADRPDAVELTGFHSTIEFENVYFRYEAPWVLQGLSFTVKKGQVVALVGSTGAGKSTVAHLLPRLYEPEEGEIRLDGKPLSAYTQQSLREQISFVPQKPFLFLDTVAENIAFGQNFTREEIILAAKRAHADEFIQNLPKGYDTQLQETGKNLSGGQQQRLAIARALVKKAPILVMDEATSSLDALSESKIKQAINELRGEVTQILIAHRLSTIEHADKIIFLEHGRKVAEGTREQLMETCPQFRVMWEIMQGGRDAGEATAAVAAWEGLAVIEASSSTVGI